MHWERKAVDHSWPLVRCSAAASTTAAATSHYISNKNNSNNIKNSQNSAGYNWSERNPVFAMWCFALTLQTFFESYQQKRWTADFTGYVC